MAARTKIENEITIVEATAVAIVSSAKLPPEVAAKVDTRQKFVVHPHVIHVPTDSALLGGYLRTIYSRTGHLGTSLPGSTSYTDLEKEGEVDAATRRLAAAMATSMEKKSANPGILFGFLIALEDGARSHGLIKADLDDELRFHYQTEPGGAWTLTEVSEMLPPPRSDWSKFAIAPAPNGAAEAGIRDITDATSAADYFLEAIELVVPRTSGTQAAVAQAALASGYTHVEVRRELKRLKADTPVAEVVATRFPKIPERRAAALQGTPTRPMTVVLKDDPYLRVYSTKRPHFELVVDDAVEVKVEGRVVTVTLPNDSDPIDYRIRTR